MNQSVKKCLSGSVLKWIAILVMLIDHIGASGLSNAWVLRQIGRTAFPLFCFLIAEGAAHTKDIRKYLLRLGVFALVSEIPFDLALYGHVISWNHQNVYWTLFLGLGVIYFFQRYPAESWKGCLAVLLLGGVAEMGHADYGAVGVAVIVCMYLLREKPWMRFLVCFGILVLGAKVEFWCFPAFALMALYNGKRGRQPRYFFYGFYPVHLLILWVMGNWLPI